MRTVAGERQRKALVGVIQYYTQVTNTEHNLSITGENQRDFCILVVYNKLVQIKPDPNKFARWFKKNLSFELLPEPVSSGSYRTVDGLSGMCSHIFYKTIRLLPHSSGARARASDAKRAVSLLSNHCQSRKLFSRQVSPGKGNNPLLLYSIISASILHDKCIRVYKNGSNGSNEKPSLF